MTDQERHNMSVENYESQQTELLRQIREEQIRKKESENNNLNTTSPNLTYVPTWAIWGVILLIVVVTSIVNGISSIIGDGIAFLLHLSASVGADISSVASSVLWVAGIALIVVALRRRKKGKSL